MAKFAAYMARRNKIIRSLAIESVASEGKCVAKNDDQVVFVSDVVPGDVVDVKISKKKKSYQEGYPIEFHAYSDLRIDPFCEHFGQCGGCKWQHLDYQSQLGYKRQQVIDNLQRIGKIALPEVNPISGADKTTFYRNKLEFTFSNRRWLTTKEIQSAEDINRNGLGFHMTGRFDRILDIRQCYLQADPSNQIRLAINQYAQDQQLAYYDILQQQGFLRNLVIRTTSIGEVMVILQVGKYLAEEIEGIMNFIMQTFPSVTSLFYVVNDKKNDTFLDQNLIHHAGQAYITEKLDHLNLRLGPKSFFQTNTKQAEILYRKVRQMADLHGSEIVYDLYTGIGSIANYIAADAEKVLGIEVVPEAIEDARINAAINQIDNVSFIASDAKDWLTIEKVDAYGKPDLVITDPPRAGMHQTVVKEILTLAPNKIIYVSCNPATQARDLNLLKEKYRVTEVQPVDMFPHTHHVENIVCLVKEDKNFQNG